jgi:hypothetical protein
MAEEYTVQGRSENSLKFGAMGLLSGYEPHDDDRRCSGRCESKIGTVEVSSPGAAGGSGSDDACHAAACALALQVSSTA